MWVYREWKENGETRFTVGYFMPDKTWVPDSTWDTRDKAAARVNYLNGGNQPFPPSP